MKRSIVGVTLFAALLTGLAFAGVKFLATTQFLAAKEETMDTSCSDRNLDYTLRAFGTVFDRPLSSDHIEQSWCIKNDFGSDMFVLTKLTDEAPIDEAQLGDPNDWAVGLIKSARSFFADALPPEATEFQAFTGFNEDATSKIIVMDFGTTGRFAYFEI